MKVPAPQPIIATRGWFDAVDDHPFHHGLLSGLPLRMSPAQQPRRPPGQALKTFLAAGPDPGVARAGRPG